MSIKLDLLSTLEEAFELALIRNECRHFMTHDQSEISSSQQKTWYQTIYTQQTPQKYWVWVLKEQNDKIIGYCAAKDEAEGVYITEGLLEKKRGRGLGTFMLTSLISQKLFKHKPLLADIFTHNHTSIALHRKFGFEEYGTVNEKVMRFILVRC